MKRGTPNHRKMHRLARCLRVSLAEAVGTMELLWHWVADYLPRGDIGKSENWEIAAAVHTPAGKLQAFFDALQGYVASPACHGCPFLNAAAEYPDPGHPVHRVAADHKLSVRRRFHQLATAAGARDPDALADALVLLMDGAYMSARLFAAAPQAPAVRLGAGASTLLRAHLGPNAGGAEPPCP